MRCSRFTLHHAANRAQKNPALSTLISAMRVYASKVVRIRNAYERHWKGLLDDCIADGHAHLDSRGSNGSAPRIHWIECHGTNRSRAESIFWPRICFPRPAWRSDQAVVVGR